MAKLGNFKIVVEMKELKIHVEGAREIAPEIASNVANQIAAIVQPAALIEGRSENHSGVIDVPATAAGSRKTRKRTTASKSDSGTKAPVSWNHDPAKWGTPIQGWPLSKKALWLLQVVADATGDASGLTLDQITDSFNSKFPDSGLINRTNIKRDLSNKEELFGTLEGRWFLKQAGKTEAATLIAEAKG
jgi:hypothetical protein